MSDSQLKKYKFRIQGMHCQSCELLIEEKFRSLPEIKSVHVNHATGKVKFMATREPSLEELNSLIKDDGYRILALNDNSEMEQSNFSCDPRDCEIANRKRHYLEIGAVLVIVLGVYTLLKQFDIIPKSLGISENMSLGFAFLIGLVAAFSSCIAVTGGMLLAVAGKYNEKNPQLSGIQKFKPHIYFNIGRLLSYALLGGVVGLVGSVLTFSSRAMGVLTIVVSIVMILLGFQLLKIFPWLQKFSFRMPKFLSRKAYRLGENENKTGPFALGAATFFLPCGFTQALQLYVLSKGDFAQGMLIMLFFALGTLPALLSLGVLSSFLKGTFQRYFVKFAGVIVIMLGLFNINNGFNLTGLSVAAIFQDRDETLRSEDANVKIVDGKQVVEMKVEGLEYYPYRFTVVKDIPVEWRIDGSGAIGCAQVVTASGLGITEYLPPGEVKVIEFTPTEVGEFAFSCSMGMTTPGAAFVVVENDNFADEISEKGRFENSDDIAYEGEPDLSGSLDCDPRVTSCAPGTVQKIKMEISRENGFYPNVFTIQKDIPVQWEIDTQVAMGGCMSTLVIPEYNIAHELKLGKTTVKFTPTKVGSVPFTCSMGIELGEFKVINS